MGQEQDKLLKRIQKLVKQNQDLIDKNEKLQKAVNELSDILLHDIETDTL